MKCLESLCEKSRHSYFNGKALIFGWALFLFNALAQPLTTDPRSHRTHRRVYPGKGVQELVHRTTGRAGQLTLPLCRPSWRAREEHPSHWVTEKRQTWRKWQRERVDVRLWLDKSLTRGNPD